MSNIVIEDLGVDDLVVCISQQHSVKATLDHTLTLIRTSMVWCSIHIQDEVPVDETHHPVVHVSYDIVA